MEYLAVAITGLVLGGWSIPLGLLLGLGPVATYLSAATGGLAGCWVFLLVGERARAALRTRRAVPKRHTSDDQHRLRAFIERHGARGLGLVGPLFPGVTASSIAGLAFGLEPGELGRWMTAGIVILYGLYTVGLWLLVALL